MEHSLGEQVAEVMASAGIKPRTFAALTGCHYTTVYAWIADREAVPLRIVQESAFDVIDFLKAKVAEGVLPMPEGLTAKQKTQELCAMYDRHKAEHTK